jgi:hypothetical protein
MMDWTRYSNPLMPVPSGTGAVFTIGVDGNTSYLVRATTMWSQPKVGHAWFPIFSSTCALTGLEGKLLEEGSSVGGTTLYRYERCTIIIRNNAEPVKVEHFDVPPPKVRKGVEVRWHQGEWQKRLKRGWVAV